MHFDCLARLGQDSLLIGNDGNDYSGASVSRCGFHNQPWKLAEIEFARAPFMI